MMSWRVEERESRRLWKESSEEARLMDEVRWWKDAEREERSNSSVDGLEEDERGLKEEKGRLTEIW